MKERETEKRYRSRKRRNTGGTLASGVVLLGAAGLLYTRLLPGGGLLSEKEPAEQTPVPSPTAQVSALAEEGENSGNIEIITEEAASESTGEEELSEVQNTAGSEEEVVEDEQGTGEESAAEMQPEPETEPEEEPYDYSGDSILSIEISGSDILYEGEPVSSAELEQKLLAEYKEGFTVSVTDNHAIKGTYDEVEAILARLSLS